MLPVPLSSDLCPHIHSILCHPQLPTYSYEPRARRDRNPRPQTRAFTTHRKHAKYTQTHAYTHRHIHAHTDLQQSTRQPNRCNHIPLHRQSQPNQPNGRWALSSCFGACSVAPKATHPIEQERWAPQPTQPTQPALGAAAFPRYGKESHLSCSRLQENVTVQSVGQHVLGSLQTLPPCSSCACHTKATIPTHPLLQLQLCPLSANICGA